VKGIVFSVRDVDVSTQLDLGPVTSSAPEELHLSSHRIASSPPKRALQSSDRNTS